jgi:4-hydroxy-tetrahydrodipicolinate synthase
MMILSGENKMISHMNGVWTALVTPMKSSGELDLAAFRNIIQNQLAAGVAGVIPGGTTGESPTLSIEEKKTLIRIALDECKGSKIKVFAGTGSNNTAETVELSRWASDQGVHGVLVVTPYYNKPSQNGLESHFFKIAEQIDCEIMLYNVPGRTGVSFTAEAIAKLAAHPRITSIKEASGSIAFIGEIFDTLIITQQKLEVLSGDDVTFLPSLAAGAVGVVSVSSNLFPRGMVALHQAFERGDTKEALRIHQYYYPLFRDLFVESNPVPIKIAMAHTGWCEPNVRLPLAPLMANNAKKLQYSLKRCGIEHGRAL